MMTKNVYQMIANKIYDVLCIMANNHMSRYLKCQHRHQPVVSPNANRPMKNMKKDTNKNIIMTNKICIK